MLCHCSVAKSSPSVYKNKLLLLKKKNILIVLRINNMKFLIFVVAAATIATSSASRIKRAPLKVSVYYESHCPDSRDFIITQLHPYFCKVQQYLDLHLVPFGKAYSSNRGFTCQHGPKECRGNTIHNCVLKRIQNSKAQVDYVNCAMHDPDQPGYIERTCVNESGVSVEEVEKCFTSQEGYNMMLRAEVETKKNTPGPRFVPTIVFDDEYNDDDQDNAFVNFEAKVCEKLVSRGYTEVCSNGMILNPQTC